MTCEKGVKMGIMWVCLIHEHKWFYLEEQYRPVNSAIIDRQPLCHYQVNFSLQFETAINLC